MARQMSMYSFAQMLETLCRLLREFPDESLASLLHHLRLKHDEQRRRREARAVCCLSPLPPPRDPREMAREELAAYLQNPQYFRHKVDLLQFARRYAVPVNACTPREEIVRLCLRMIYDIPKGVTILRFLAEQRDSLILDNSSPVGH